ncbi:hypothetical protein PR048_005773 [Dryococelus australis]|uniref:Uncharacterized protein n=1 Tax=Dryococelus australis TaxID=614101 RepID=A0ABQ9I964_9NEOP|nr:hypothetical protein PR048_005773 [Dryococelus australis]
MLHIPHSFRNCSIGSTINSACSTYYKDSVTGSTFGSTIDSAVTLVRARGLRIEDPTLRRFCDVHAYELSAILFPATILVASIPPSWTTILSVLVYVPSLRLVETCTVPALSVDHMGRLTESLDVSWSHNVGRGRRDRLLVFAREKGRVKQGTPRKPADQHTCENLEWPGQGLNPDRLKLNVVLSVVLIVVLTVVLIVRLLVVLGVVLILVLVVVLIVVLGLVLGVVLCGMLIVVLIGKKAYWLPIGLIKIAAYWLQIWWLETSWPTADLLEHHKNRRHVGSSILMPLGLARKHTIPGEYGAAPELQGLGKWDIAEKIHRPAISSFTKTLLPKSGSGSARGGGERSIPEKIRRPMASSDTIPTCESPVTRPGIEPGLPWWEASVLIAQPPNTPACIFRIHVPRCTIVDIPVGSLPLLLRLPSSSFPSVVAGQVVTV